MVYFIYILLFIFSICSLYSTLLGRLDGTAGTIGYIVQICMVILESVSVFIVIKNFETILSKKLNLVVFIWMAYSIVVVAFTSNNIFDDIRYTLWWPCIYFLFYQIARTDCSGKNIKPLISIFIPLIFLSNFILYVSLRKIGLEDNLADNSVFYVLLLLPCSCLINKKMKYLFLFIVVFSSLYSFKRSAVLCILPATLFIIFFDIWHNKKLSIKPILVSTVLVLGLSSAIYLYGGRISENLYVLSRFDSISEDRGSGRLDIWKDVYNQYQEEGAEFKILGSGYNAVYIDKGISAHNDFLEMLYDFGIIGVFLYFLFVIGLVKNIFKSKKLEQNYFEANVVMFIIFLIMSSVSHLWLYPNYYAYLIIIVSITYGLRHNQNFIIS